MRATLKLNGDLELKAETPNESYALIRWKNECCFKTTTTFETILSLNYAIVTIQEINNKIISP